GVLNKYIVEDFDYEQASVVDSIRGSFFFIRREALEKLGGLDEQFFVWFEEVDYCRRVYQAGGEVWYSPAASATDLVGQSFKLLSRGKAQEYFRDSQLKYFRKWQPGWQVFILRIGWAVSNFLVWIFKKSN
ncbi:MAG TPA: glycosyltransferase, partial [bacterium]|nr:glycosyltransferase [bacterium]